MIKYNNMDDKLKKLYDLYVQSGLIQSTDFNTFKSANPEQIKKLYSLGKQSELFQTTDFNTFSSAFIQKPKKKVTTASTGGGGTKPSSSASLSKTFSSGVQKVVESVIKPDGTYRYPGREDALYKKTNNQWYIDLGKTGKYVKVNEQKRIDALETYAKKYTADIVKPAMDVVKDVAKGATQLIDKATAPSAAELQKDVKKEIDYLESQKELSNKEMADILGWSEADVERVSKSSGKTLTPPSKTAAANVRPIINTNAQPAIEQMSQNTQKAMHDLGVNAAGSEEFIERVEYYNTKDLQIYLKNQGYDVDVNGDKEDKKTQSATKHLNMTEKIFIDDMYESMDQSDRVFGLVNENMLSMSEEEAVPLLRKYFAKDGFKFNETGLGNYIEVVSPGGKKQTFGFNTDDPEDINKLRTFLSDTYLAKNEKQKYRDLLEGDDVDMDDPRARDKYFYDLVTLIGKNPDKYADIIGDPDNILSSTHPIKNAIDRTAYNAKAESIQLNKDYEALKIRIDRYNANPEKYGPKEKAAINNTLHDLKVREYKLLGDYKKLSSMDNSLRRITGRKILESKQSGDWAGVLTSTLFKGVTALPLLGTQVAMDVLPYAVGAENFFDPITYSRLKDVDGYTDLEIEDLGAKKLKQTIYGDLERGIMNVGSSGTTTPEYINDPERNDILKGLSFMAESVGTALASGGSGTLQKLGFFAMSYNGMEKEMMDPRFDDMSESEKKLYSVPYGFVIGALERFGYNALAGGDKSLVNRFATGVIGRTLAGLPKDATISSIKREINKNIGKMIADGVVNVTGGVLAEGTVEGLQKVFEIGEKYAINQIKDKEYFQGIPDLSTWKGIKETYNLAKDDFYYASIGALVFSSGTNSLQTMQQYRFNGKTDAEFEVLYNSVSNPFLRSMTELDIKTRLAKGEINKEEAASQIQAINDVAGRVSRINPDLSLRDKKESFNLILEKEKLEKEKAPLDEALQAPYNVRINEINEELKTIANNAFQKQTTSEVPVQPEAAVSGEVAQGVPQAEPQVSTQEGGQAIGKEEVSPIQATAAQAQEEVESYIVDRVKNLKLEPVIDPLLNKMNNAEYIDDADIDNALEVIFKELDDIDNSEYSDNVKSNVKDSLLNLAEKLDNYEFRTKDKTVTVAQKRAADSTRENVQKVKVEEFFSGAKAIHNGEEVEFDTTSGRVEAKLPDGNTIVFDTPSMEVKEGGIVIGDDGNLSTVTMVDRFGSEFTFDGDIALDLAIKDRQNKIGEIPPPVFDIVMEEMTVKEPYIKERTVQPQPTAQPTATEVKVTPVQPTEVAVTPVAEAQPVVEAQPTEAQPVVEAQPAQEVDQELEALRTLLQGTDEQIDEQVAGLDISDRNDKVAENIANAAKAVSNILPDVQFIVHDTDESYRQAAGETNRKQSSRGTYIPATENTPAQIHINSTKANNRTAAHEVFHAVLLNAVKSDAEAQRLTKRMIEAVMKSMGNIEGQQGLKKYLFDFAANYEENVRNEEKLAELLGVLATNYKSLDAPTKGIIKRFLERIAKLVGLKSMTDKEVVDFMNTMADALGKGTVISKEDIAMLPKPRKRSVSNIIKRFQSDFSDAFSKLSFVYDKNGAEFKKLEENGFITKDKSLSDFNGKYMFLHQPDAAFSGMIYKDGEILVEGKGGVFYPIKFHKDGYFWASTDRTAQKMAEDLNKVFEQNNGVIYMALTSAPSDKLLSSTTMSNAVLDFFSSKAFDKNFKITESQFKVALRNAANNFVIKKMKNDEGKVISKKVGLQLNLPGNATISEMKLAIKDKLNPDNSSFADRKQFVLELIKLMSNQINKNDVSIEQFGKLFSQGIQNKYFKGITKTGKLKISAANMSQALSEMFTEPILKEGINRESGGQVYAVIELKGKVKAVDSDKHESYPKAIQSDNSSNKVTLHILKDRLNWSDVFEDFETNKIVSKDRLKKVYPTSGVSVRGLKLNTGKISARKQLPTDKEFKPGYEAALNALGETEQQREQWRKNNKVNQKQKRNTIVEQAAKDYYNELITQKEYLDIVAKNQPIKSFKQVPDLPTLEEITNSLDTSKVATGIVGLTKNIEDGERVASRLDIPAYEDYDTWVVSIHDGVKEGKSIAYGQTAVLKNVEFKTFPGPAIRIAMGNQNKSTIARIFGDWKNENPEAVHERAKELMNDPAWTQVGMNPFRNSWFYDKSDGMPLASAEEVIQVGALVLAKNAVKVSPDNQMFETKSSKGNKIRFQQPARSITQIINTARNAGFSDAKIEKYLREEGYTDTEIQQSLYGVSTTMGIDEIFERSNKALQRKFDDPAYVRALRYVNKLIFERQEGIKRLIKGINNKDASRVNAMLVNKSGATGFASERFKEAENKIYGRLGGVSPQQRKENRDTLDKMIYLRRFIAINENRRRLGEEPYIGMGKFNEEKAREELEGIRQKIGQKKFDKFSKRADLYFAEYKESLKMLYDSGRINKETYENLKDIEYSPIRVIKYIIDDNADPNEVESQANRLGVSRKDIQKLSNLNENEIILDSRWLLMLNIHSVAARAFENKMLNSFASALNNATQEETEYLDKFIKKNPTIGTKQDGTPKQQYNMMNTPVGYTPVVYFDKGVQKVLVVKDEYAQQLLDIKNVDSSLRFLAALTLGNVLRYFATVGNPLFIVGNIPVDVINAAFFTDVYSPFKPIAVIQATTGLAYRFLQDILYDVAPLYESIRKIFSKDKTNREYRNRVKEEYITHGGAMGTMAEEGIRSLEKGYLLARGIEKNTRKTLITVGKATSYLGSKSEIAMRLAVYNKRKKNLISKFKKEHGQMPNEQELDDIMWEATREARELIDFSQGGEFIKKADQVIPYLNAATQGLRKQGKFAVENKVLFASNVLQAMGMFAGIAAYSLANAYAAFSDDEEDKDKLNKKVTDAIDSISEHEKAQFHIIFTGRKVVVDGKVELEYIRIKKLPFFSIATSYAEQYAMRYWINKNGGKYDIDNKLMMSIILKSLPLLPQEIASRNPMVAALVAYNFNYDFFTKKEIVRGLNELNIRPESEGMYDKKVEDFYKIIAPAMGLSPKRTKAAVEKIITAPSTNPLVHVLYGAMNGIFSDKTSLSEDMKVAGQMILESATKKMVRTTDHEILRYIREDKYKEEVTKIKTEINEAQQKVNSLINDKLEKGEKYTNQELMKIVEENFPKYDREKYFKKYKTKMMFPDLDKEILDIVYEEEPQVQALKLYGRYGNALEEDEKAELIKVMRSIKKKISPKVFRIYNEEYKNR